MDPTYRAAARMHFEPPYLMQAHPAAFVDHAHRIEQPEPLLLRIAVLVAGIVSIGVLVAAVMWGIPQ